VCGDAAVVCVCQYLQVFVSDALHIKGKRENEKSGKAGVLHLLGSRRSR
jgi:hypothetical protein